MDLIGELPTEQSAIIITAPGGPEALQPHRVPVPRPHDHDVLIRVKAAGVNRHDCNQRRRGPTPSHSDIPGLEVSGVVAAVGARVRNVDIGEKVCALVDGGGYALYALASAGQVLALPPGLDPIDAAAVPEAAFTVWHNFFNVAQLGPGESVLIHGGTSGVGIIAIQLLHALGHPVYATCGSPEKVDVAQRLGARIGFDYRGDDFVAGVLASTRGRGVDVILDMSGGRYSDRNLEALARRGRLVHLTPGDGAVFEASLRAIMAKEARVTGSMLRPLPDDEKAAIAAELERVLWPLLEDGTVRPMVHAVLPLNEAAEAHRLMEAGEHIGKIVLAPEPVGQPAA